MRLEFVHDERGRYISQGFSPSDAQIEHIMGGRRSFLSSSILPEREPPVPTGLKLSVLQNQSGNSGNARNSCSSPRVWRDHPACFQSLYWLRYPSLLLVLPVFRRQNTAEGVLRVKGCVRGREVGNCPQLLRFVAHRRPCCHQTMNGGFCTPRLSSSYNRYVITNREVCWHR